MPNLQINDCRINYQAWGESGPWITLINGHTRTLKDFRIFSKKLVSEGFRVLTMDNRGAGDTIAGESFSFDHMVNDVSILWKYLDIKKTHLLGISMGGWISQQLASRYRSHILSLVLVSTSRAVPSSIRAFQPWGETIEPIKERLQQYFSERFLLKNRLLIESMAKQILRSNINGEFDRSAFAQRKAINSIFFDDVNDYISCPTLILHGGEDHIIPVEEAKVLNEKISLSTLEVFKEVGHLLLAECPTDFYRIVIDFLKQYNAVELD